MAAILARAAVVLAAAAVEAEAERPAPGQADVFLLAAVHDCGRLLLVGHGDADLFEARGVASFSLRRSSDLFLGSRQVRPAQAAQGRDGGADQQTTHGGNLLY